jgi:hypothetical protein
MTILFGFRALNDRIFEKIQDGAIFEQAVTTGFCCQTFEIQELSKIT